MWNALAGAAGFAAVWFVHYVAVVLLKEQVMTGEGPPAVAGGRDGGERPGE
jgi:hypothetical protein